MCYHINPNVSDVNVIDKLRDGLFVDMFKVVRSEPKTPVTLPAEYITTSGATRKEIASRDKPDGFKFHGRKTL